MRINSNDILYKQLDTLIKRSMMPKAVEMHLIVYEVKYSSHYKQLQNSNTDKIINHIKNKNYLQNP